METVLLYIGPFDPVALPELMLAQKEKEAYKASEVFFWPLKGLQEEGGAGLKERREMLQCALKEQEGFFLAEEENCSLKSLEAFRTKHQGAELILLGREEDLKPWAEETELRLSDIEERQEAGAAFLEEEKIRKALSAETVKPVLDYIAAHELYSIKKIETYMKPHRYLHALSVANLSYQIAEANGLDKERAYLAGLLHDITRKEAKACYCKKAFIENKKYFPGGLLPSWAYHQFTAVMVLQDDFGLKDPEILDAIGCHTTGKGQMSPLAKVLYAADKIEPTRGYDSKQMIEAMLKDYDQGFRLVLKTNRDFLLKQTGGLSQNDELTKACFKAYLKGE